LLVKAFIKIEAEEPVSAEITVQEIIQLIPDHDTWFWWDNLVKRDHLQYVSVDGRSISKCIFK
jgi:hypothetical protein